MAYLFAGPYSDRPVPEGSDVDFAYRGHITLTPLSLDLTLCDDNGRPVRLAD